MQICLNCKTFQSNENYRVLHNGKLARKCINCTRIYHKIYNGTYLKKFKHQMRDYAYNRQEIARSLQRKRGRKTCKLLLERAFKLESRTLREEHQQIKRDLGFTGVKSDYRRKCQEKGIDFYDLWKRYPNIYNCDVCGTTENLCIDHCHSTSTFRGILCSNHNSALGFVRDDVEVLEKLIEYVNKHKSS